MRRSIALILFTLPGLVRAQDERTVDEILSELQQLDDAELRQTFQGASGDRTPLRDLCLSEIVRRGGDAWVAYLEECRLRTSRVADLYARAGELELLTALRRVQGEPDPVSVRFDGPPGRECTFPDLPVFSVALTNADRRGASVAIQNGGDYRGGRWGRWRFSVRPSGGREHPIRLNGGNLGGLTSRNLLEPGQSWRAELPMRVFVDSPPPGEYEVEIQYHDRLYLSNYLSTEGLFVCRSEKISLVVTKRVIALSAQDRRAATNLVEPLDPGAPLKILPGPYGPWAHEFVPPDSVPGRLLDLGWTAVPALLARLESDGPSTGERAWLLSLLYSVTGLEDPREEEGVLPSYEYLEPGFSLLGGVDPARRSGGMSGRSQGSESRGVVDEERQRSFARRWVALREHIRADGED